MADKLTKLTVSITEDNTHPPGYPTFSRLYLSVGALEGQFLYNEDSFVPQNLVSFLRSFAQRLEAMPWPTN